MTYFFLRLPHYIPSQKLFFHHIIHIHVFKVPYNLYCLLENIFKVNWYIWFLHSVNRFKITSFFNIRAYPAAFFQFIFLPPSLNIRRQLVMPLELSYPPWVTTDMTFILSLTSICSYLYLFDISGNQPPAPFYENSKRRKIEKEKKG